MNFAHVISQKVTNGNGLNIACEVDRDATIWPSNGDRWNPCCWWI